VDYDRFDAVLVKFPFTEREGHKQRPAIVLSQRAFNASHAHCILAMVTTAARTTWPSDLSLVDVTEAGLRTSCVVRWKVFTLVEDLILGKIGTLSNRDRTAVQARLGDLLAG
jgi:mRNA interferase MazF